MFQLFRLLMDSRKLKASSLSKTLSKKIKKESENCEIDKTHQIPDIEEIVKDGSAIRSAFFSPLQTRSQRSKNMEGKLSMGQMTQEIFETNDIKDSKLFSTDQEPNDFEVKLCKATKAKIKASKSKEEKVEIKIIECSPSMSEKKDRKDWEPKNWRAVLANIRQMRSNVSAPVDVMGCEACADTNTDEKTQRFHKLVALMLSSQTKDEVTFGAMTRLKGNLLTPISITKMPLKRLEELIYPVGFYKNKAKYIHQTSFILVEKYNSDIPRNIKELIALPGVGPKMAHICMATAWNEITGIGVDVHVHRIANRLNWVPTETKEPEQTRLALEAWLPRDLWNDVNHLFVGFGQTICTPTKPHCEACSNSFICPSAHKVTPRKKNSKRNDETNNEVTPEKKSKESKKNISKEISGSS